MLTTSKISQISIPAGAGRLPIEIFLIGRFPTGAGKAFLTSGFKQLKKNPEFVDEYNEPSALIGKTHFSKNDPTAIYGFGVDYRDLVFHRHAGHRVIIGVTGEKGCILKFSTCTHEEAQMMPELFLKKMILVKIPGDHLFTLRFNGSIYHQFSPMDYSEKAFLAISVHTNEAGGLSGDLLEKILTNQSSIPLLTEPAPTAVMEQLQRPDAYQFAKIIELGLE